MYIYRIEEFVNGSLNDSLSMSTKLIVEISYAHPFSSGVVPGMHFTGQASVEPGAAKHVPLAGPHSEVSRHPLPGSCGVADVPPLVDQKLAAISPQLLLIHFPVSVGLSVIAPPAE